MPKIEKSGEANIKTSIKSMWVMQAETFWYFTFEEPWNSNNKAQKVQTIWTVIPVVKRIDKIKWFESLDKFWSEGLRRLRLATYTFASPSTSFSLYYFDFYKTKDVQFIGKN